ncbi:Gamma-secretase subunit PEN-2 [Paramuricea clavata]|uniref:Gamma-secretase subunit PEN-2 n=1 Tax=Paramuricea clavata TaxID=317549 RepID=A0A7D9E176_PARCT|nr:Gamma-secretase subunit PEN-2 [Paramuricea clavata]
MDLRKVSDQDKLQLCRRYFVIGFAFLPFLWFVNFVWFFKYAFYVKHFEGQKKMRYYLTGSLIGFLVWFIGLTVWISVYQKNRASWGATGDMISFLIPLGEP